jgi:hypothetical protein
MTRLAPPDPAAAPITTPLAALVTEDVARRLSRARTFFLAGVMQGSRSGDRLADQSYRDQLHELIRAARPEAEIRDPGRLMATWLGPREADLRAAHGRLLDRTTLRRTEFEPAITDLTGVFERLVALAAASDVCIGWLPGQEASMGTAVEMWAAHQAGRLVLAITPMRQNLAVLACSDVILPDLDRLGRLLTAGLDEGADGG